MDGRIKVFSEVDTPASPGRISIRRRHRHPRSIASARATRRRRVEVVRLGLVQYVSRYRSAAGPVLAAVGVAALAVIPGLWIAASPSFVEMGSNELATGTVASGSVVATLAAYDAYASN